MVLESILSAQAASKRPLLAVAIGALFAIAAVVLSLWIFPPHASLVLVFLASLAFVPLFFGTVQQEEQLELQGLPERVTMAFHGRSLAVLLATFVGMSIIFAICYIVLPNGEGVFSVQTQTIAGLSKSITGNATGAGIFSMILLNNLKVMIFCFLFSLIYGFGAVFILTWNASVIGAALGVYIQRGADAAMATGAHSLTAFASAGGLSMLRYFTHGIPEIAGYVVGGMAGGILSIAIVNKHWSKDNMDRVLLDTSNLMIIGLCILVVAGIVEVWITPLLV